MADNKEYMTHQESMGTIQISEDVVASIATSACLEVGGRGRSDERQRFRLCHREKDDRQGHPGWRWTARASW